MTLEPRTIRGRYVHLSKTFFKAVKEVNGIQHRELRVNPGVTFSVGRNKEKRIARTVQKGARALGVAHAATRGTTWPKCNVGILAGLLDDRRSRQLGLAS